MLSLDCFFVDDDSLCVVCRVLFVLCVVFCALVVDCCVGVSRFLVRVCCVRFCSSLLVVCCCCVCVCVVGRGLLITCSLFVVGCSSLVVAR